MKLALGLFVNTEAAWQALLKQEFAPSLGYKLGKYAEKVRAESARFEQNRTNMILKTHGVLVEDDDPRGPRHEVPPEGVPAFQEAMGELMCTETDIEQYPLAMSALLEALDAFKGNHIAPELTLVLERFFLEG